MASVYFPFPEQGQVCWAMIRSPFSAAQTSRMPIITEVLWCKKMNEVWMNLVVSEAHFFDLMVKLNMSTWLSIIVCLRERDQVIYS